MLFSTMLMAILNKPVDWQYQLREDTSPRMLCACTRQQALLTIAELHPDRGLARLSRVQEW